MKNISIIFVLGILMFTALGCGMVGKIAEKSMDIPRADSLWPDVPRMDGLDPSQTDMPLPLKVFIKTVLNNAWRADNSKDPKPVSTDFIVFGYNGKPDDVKNFYTADKMHSIGRWETGDSQMCIDESNKGLNANVCLYKKIENGKQEGLAIIALPTEEKNIPTFVYFIRLETEADANAKKQ